MNEKDTGILVAFGEALWDCLPSGLFLGGAPLNVAYHAARLGWIALPATCVGRDFLGDQALQRMKNGKMDTRLVSAHPYLTTGVAIAQIDASGSARYDIRQPCAWDDIRLEAPQEAIVDQADALVYGTLAARSEVNRATLDRLLDGDAALKLCDVNLRPPFDDRERALAMARRADLVKLNGDELYALADLDSGTTEIEDALARCQELLGVEAICVTRGAEGAIAWERGEIARVPSEPVMVEDTIGAGDAFTAALAVFTVRRLPLEERLRRATRLGSFVASRRGAQPEYDAKRVFGDISVEGHG